MWKVLYWVTTVLYETSKLNKVQLCMDCSHFCKQYHLECVNIPETVNNSMQLGFSFPFHFEVSCTNQLLILLIQHKYKRETSTIYWLENLVIKSIYDATSLVWFFRYINLRSYSCWGLMPVKKYNRYSNVK